MIKWVLTFRILGINLIILLLNSFMLGQEYRSYSGMLNSIGTFWGGVYDTVVQIAQPDFEDGISVPSGINRPNPRVISNTVFTQTELKNDPLGLSAYTWAWGQFIDHDITLSLNHHSEEYSIQVPMGDQFFDPDWTGDARIPMMRSNYLPRTGTDKNNPRRYFNETTAFIDGSGVYGDNEERAMWLRTHEGGRLKVSDGNLLPYNTIDGAYEGEIDPESPFMDMPFPHIEKWFVAGDPRANENPVLIAIHTLFVREHNRLCEEIIAEHPEWNDEKIFQEARKMVGALIQAIVYEEWLPTLGIELEPYRGYDKNVNPGITNVFSTAAYRYGHSTITPELFLMDNDGNYMEKARMSLREVFFNPGSIIEMGGIEPFLIGSAFLVQQDLDCSVIDDLRNFLFGTPGQGGLDLVSLNINRGRDRGLPDFNRVRSAYGLEPYTSFENITHNPLLARTLENLYNNINDIDPWVGMLAEDNISGSLFGPTSDMIISYQFDHLRHGDRFYYESENLFNEAAKYEIKNTKLADIIKRNTDITIIHDRVFNVMTNNEIVNRTIDGTLNNPFNPNWGSSGEKVVVETPMQYGDNVFTPGGENRPNPRLVSNEIFAQEGDLNDPLNLSAYTWAWGQFIDHDIVLSPELHEEVISFDIPRYDPFFDPNGTGVQTMSIRRSAYDHHTGLSAANPRIPINGITAYIDGSGVYGSDTFRAEWLRSGIGGKLKTSSGNMLPFNTVSGEYNGDIDYDAPEMAMPFPQVTKYFVAGDVRANENPFLTAMHTIFLREHNRQCELISKKNPEWSDEEIYQYARKIVGGKIEAIVYEEWLPTMGIDLPEYEGYNSTIHPGILNVFSTAAFRYGHSTIGGELVRLNQNNEVIPQGNISLRDAFFNPDAILELDGIEPYLQGMATVVEQDFDCHVVDDLRNFLFGDPGHGGFDLVSLNIFRGRERGLADYNSIRKHYGLTQINSFEELSSDPVLNQHFESVYGNVDLIDPWAGFLAEDHMDDALFGESAMYILSKQFQNLRDGDYFYYENDPVLLDEEIAEIKSTTLSSIIRNNSDVSDIQDEIFRVFNTSTSVENIDYTYQKLKIYPNPAKDHINIMFPENNLEYSEYSFELYNTAGQLVMRMPNQRLVPNQQVTIPLDNELPTGLYLARASNQYGIIQTKFLINN